MNRFARIAAIATVLLVLAPAGRPGAGSAFANGFPICPGGLYTYRVYWDGKAIDGILSISGLRRTTEVVTARKGGDPSAVRRAPGVTAYEPIVLERCRGADAEFERWANKVWNFGAGLGAEVSLGDFRKDIRIELLDDDGRAVIAYRVYRCWPSDYAAVTAMEGNGLEPAKERLVLQHEGWERDADIVAPEPVRQR
ncbi:MAG: phage tail protein [Candidatus Eisenbacteria bacterium]|nr:phage tail protein [Candidatus Eisenbacteria bacterium]